jgi:hypothetical protein
MWVILNVGALRFPVVRFDPAYLEDPRHGVLRRAF